MKRGQVEDIYQLSPTQQGMLFESLGASESGMHIEQMIYALYGDLDLAAFTRAWQQIVDQHAMLRTGLVWKDQDEPLQVVLKQVQVPLEQQDWRDLAPLQQQERLEAYLGADRRRGFDMSKAPLLRLALFRLDEDVYQLVWTYHHILMDGWCRPVIFKDLFSYYEAFRRNQVPPAKQSRSYGDYIDWLNRQDLSEAEVFWRKALDGFAKPTPLGVEADFSADFDPQEHYGEQEIRLSEATTETLQSLARQHRLTLNTLLQGVWALLLSRYSGEDDVVFGTTVSGRPPELAEAELMVGLFINTLPFRVKVFPHTSLLPWLKDLQSLYLELRPYEYCSAGQVHQWSKVPGSLPLFESILVFENYPVDPSMQQALTIEMRSVHFKGAYTKHPLTILVSTGSELRLQLIYDRRRLEQDDVRRVLAHFQTLLQSIAADPGQHLAILLDLLPVDQIPRISTVPQSDRQKSRGVFVAPRTPEEETLASIWAEALGLERVSVHDSFFELGGHSLLAMQIVQRVRQAFQIEFPLRTLFESPTIAGLATAIAQSQHKQKAGDSVTSLPTITPAPQDRYLPFPLTDIQQAYWIGRSANFELGNVSTHSYTEYDAVELDLERFELAWQRVIERHDMLRAIVRPDGQQQVLEHLPPFRIQVLDLRGQDPQTVADQIKAVRERMSHQVLPSDQWPLFEICASILDDERIRLHTSVDVLIGDGWSWNVIYSELNQFYENPELMLPPLELTFRDCVLAEIAFHETEFYRRSLEYWRNRLPTLPPAPELPLTKNPASLTHPRFVRREHRLGPGAWRRLKTRAAQAGLTPSGILLAAFAQVLTVWSKNPRFTINLTLFNRLPLHPQVNDIVGDFTSLTMLEVDNSTPATFQIRAQRIQQQLWDDLDHRYVSGVHVLRELAQMEGGMPRAIMPVVFTSMLVHTKSDSDQDAPDQQEHDSEQTAAQDDTYSISQTPQVWLDHIVRERQGALHFNWDAVEDLFPPGFLDDMFDAYCRLLQRLASEEPVWHEEAPTLLPAAQLAQRAAVNATAAPISEELLHTLFAAQVAQRPQQAALVTSDRRLSYAELHRRANQAGHWLRERGAQPNQLVAVVMDKGWEQAVAVLGALYAGAAYLPVDPDLPPERVTYLLQHGQVALALTQPWLDQKLSWPEGIERLCVADEVLAGLDETPLPPLQGVTDLAYVIFTSGSTGLPKGVMIDHLGAVNTILDINQRFGVTPADRVFAISQLSFDLSVYDVFGALAAGGTIVMPDAVARRDPAHWLALLRQERVTLWDSVPALLEMLVEYVEGRGEQLPASLRLVFMSGDWIPVTLPDRIRALADSIEIWSGGGATEASIWSILYPIEQVDPGWTSIPYGKPMRNQSLHVLDGALAPRPVWVPGELYIGGAGLAQGYWRDEDKTAASFVAAPPLTPPQGGGGPQGRGGERLYRTGDLGRYLPDGNIEFLGREDFQVKIRGHRIELGEIEAALLLHPAVQAGVVTAAGDSRGDRRLVAYVVPDQASLPGDEPAAQDYVPQATEGIILDPIERLRFKLGHPGLRRDDGRPSGVQLTRPELDETQLAAYVARRSYRKFDEQPVSLESFGRLLSGLAALELQDVPLPKYRYGSAGSLYPVQVYLYVRPGRVQGVSGGAYYYHPLEHRLVLLSQEAHLAPNAFPPGNREIFEGCAFAIFLVGQMDAIKPLYGEWARNFCLLEAGLMTQVLEQEAPVQQIGLCQIGGFDFESLRPWFALGEGHVYLHGLLGGRVTVEQTQLSTLVEDSGDLRALVQLLSEGGAEKEGYSGPSFAAPRFREPGTDGRLVEELAGFIREKLPAYMVPSAFVLLDALPLTPNGKVDRKALPAPEVSKPQQEKIFVAPQTKLEQAIAAVWQEVLQLSKVGIHDSFFDLGGNSVHIVRAYNKLREMLGQDLPIVKMFEYPTIHSLVKYINQDQDEYSVLQETDDRADARVALRRRRRQSRQQALSDEPA